MDRRRRLNPQDALAAAQLSLAYMKALELGLLDENSARHYLNEIKLAGKPLWLFPEKSAPPASGPSR